MPMLASSPQLLSRAAEPPNGRRSGTNSSVGRAVRRIGFGLVFLLSLGVTAPAQDPDAAPARNTHSAATTRNLRTFLNYYLLHSSELSPEDAIENRDFFVKYAAATVLLNDSGRPVHLVYVSSSSYWCGSGGCTVLVVGQSRGRDTVLAMIGQSRLPIVVLPTTTHGWHDLRVFAAGGDSRRNGYDVYRYDGRDYVLAIANEPRASAERGRTVISRSPRYVKVYP